MMDFSQRLYIGSHAHGSATGLQAFSLNEATDFWEVVFQTPEPMSIQRLGFLQIAMTSPPNYKISLQGVDGAGHPDGVIKGGVSPASKVFTPSSNNFNWITLENAYSAARGEFLALVIGYESGTIGASNFVQLRSVFSGYNGKFPYGIENNNGTRTRRFIAPFGYGPANKAFGFPFNNSATTQINSGSSPNEAGVKFTLPRSWGATYKLVGARVTLSPTAGHTIRLQLYNGGGAADTTVLQSVDHDTDAGQSTGAGSIWELYFDETELTTLRFGSAYRLTLAPQSATNQGIPRNSVASAADLDALPVGQNLHWTQRAGGNWTDSTTLLPFFELIIADLKAEGHRGTITVVKTTTRRRVHRF
jgi:hypothetical protein